LICYSIGNCNITGIPGIFTITGIPGNIESMKVHLPNSAFIGNIDSFLAKIDMSNPGILEITANKSWLSLHPIVLAMVAAMSLGVKQENIKFEDVEAKSGHYLVVMGLYEFLGIRPPDNIANVAKRESSGKYIPVRLIKNSKELSAFLEDMIPLLHLNDNPEQAKAVRYIMYEVVRNVFEHSGYKNGAIVCAQYFQKSNSFRIGIVDAGVGIRNSIGESYSTKSDIEAIGLALRPGITGTTVRKGGTESNAGAGLFFTKSIAYINRSFFMMYSGNALYKLLSRDPKKPVTFLNADPFKDKHSKKDNLPYWQGTAVGVDMSLDNTGEFKTLLNLIGAVYAGGVKDKRRAQYKKARFI
jgi:anti-sigma regulatory factor (Ser/Thr protein kinase)